MIRGTTAQFKFEIPYDWNTVANANVVFWQDGNDGPDETRPLPIRKIKGDCVWIASDKMVTVTLQPEETARFSDDRKAKVQLSATTFSGIRFASEQQDIVVYPIYLDDVWEDVVPPSEDDGYAILDAGEIGE